MRVFVPVLLFAPIALVAAPALAQLECAADSDCPTGLRCEELDAEPCVAEPPSCLPGLECPPRECEPERRTACVPAPCTTDADCGAGLVCLEVTYESCSDGPAPCVPGEMCAPIDAGAGGCSTTTERFCGPSYVAPCNADADCGGGFDCVAEETCGCSGGGSVPGEVPEEVDAGAPADGGADGGSGSDAGVRDSGTIDIGDVDGGTSECSCRPTGSSVCEAREVVCMTDAECPAGWSCAVDDGPRVRCDDEMSCPPEAPRSLCIPPFAEYGYDSNGGGEAIDRAAGGASPEVTRMASAGPGSDAGRSESCSAGGKLPVSLPVAFGLLAALGIGRRRRR